MKQEIVIGTRGSMLALWQANYVKSTIEKKRPELKVKLHKILTSGDRFTDRPLLEVGGKGLFVKEIEEELLAGNIDLAVHSLKDVPAELADGLILSAIPPRESPFDMLISDAFSRISQFPKGSRIGTSSLRRMTQIRRINRDVDIFPMRGNIDTRIKHLKEGRVDGIILAAAGINRLGFSLPGQSLEEEMIPAIGQGVLAIESREESHELNLLLRAIFHDEATEAEIVAERAIMKGLGADCHSAIGALARVCADQITVTALVLNFDGSHFLEESIIGEKGNAEMVGKNLCQRLIERGAKALMGKG